MGFVADAVGAVVGAVADVASTVVETVADNPILAVAAVGAGIGLAGLAAEGAVGTMGTAVAGAGVDAAGMGLIGPTLLGAEGATAGALAAAEMSAAAGAGVLGGGALSGGLTLLPAAAGSTEALTSGTALAGDVASGGMDLTAGFTGSTGEIGPTSLLGNPVGAVGPTGEMGPTSLFSNLESIPSTTDALSQSQAALNVSGSPVAVDNLAQNITQSVVSQGGTVNQASSIITAVNNGTPLSTATQAIGKGTLFPNPFTEIATNLTNTFDAITAPANNLLKSMSNTLFPGVDPTIAKFGTQTIVNTALNGGDLESALKNAGIGTAAGFVGSTVAGQTADTLGKTGSNIAGNVAKTLTGTALSGGDLSNAATQIALNAGMNQVGSLVKNPYITSAIGTGANIALGQDPSTALTNLAINQATPLIKDIIPFAGADPTSATGILSSIGTGLIKNELTGATQGVPSPTQLTTAPRITPTPTQVSPLTQLAQGSTTQQIDPATGLPVVKKPPVAPTTIDPKLLTPITPTSNIAGLTSILQPRA